jgi:TRAP-type C4-dicarboxylate transport system substrate-binding protein
LGTLLVLGAVSASSDARAEETITIGTPAPRSSPWGKVFRVWKAAVKKKTDGKLNLKFYWNSQQGGEGAMIGKMRAGQLDGAAVTAAGLGKIYKPVVALQTPGLFYDWKTLDKVRGAMESEIKKGIEDSGFYLAGFGDVGLYHLMSIGREVRVPDDLKVMKPYRLSDDYIIPTVAQVIGFTPVPMTIPEILPALTSGRINVALSPALAAEQLQWAPQCDHLLDKTMATGIGGIIFSLDSIKRLEKKDAELAKVLKSTGAKAASMLTKRIRQRDQEAYDRIKQRMSKVTTLTADEDRKWEEVFAKVRQRLAQGTFEPALIQRIEKMAGK